MPALYLRRSNIVEAEQWFPGKEVVAQSQIFYTNDWWFQLASGAALPISPGDWLVRDPDAHAGFIPVPYRVFRVLYEPLDGGDPEELSQDPSYFL